MAWRIFYNHNQIACLGAIVAEETTPMLRTVLLVILILALIGSLPTWPYSSGWGYYPSGGLGLVVIILLILALSGRL